LIYVLLDTLYMFFKKVLELSLLSVSRPPRQIQFYKNLTKSFLEPVFSYSPNS
jgi:uncharacterized protein YaaR (DUF327 family)